MCTSTSFFFPHRTDEQFLSHILIKIILQMCIDSEVSSGSERFDEIQVDYPKQQKQEEEKKNQIEASKICL